jgi:hypothetical protein
MTRTLPALVVLASTLSAQQVLVTRLEYAMTRPVDGVPTVPKDPPDSGKLVMLESADGRQRQDYIDSMGNPYQITLINYSTQTNYQLTPASKQYYSLGKRGDQMQSHKESKAAHPPNTMPAESIAGMKCVQASTKPMNGPGMSLLDSVSCKDPVTDLYVLARYTLKTSRQTVTYTLTKAPEHYVQVDSKTFDVPSDYTKAPQNQQ